MDLFFDTRQGFRRYVLLMSLVATLPALVLAAALNNFLLYMGIDPESVGPSFEFKNHAQMLLFFAAAISAGPLVESLVMAAWINLMRMGLTNVYLVSVLSALTWATVHSLSAPAWGLGVLWQFFVFSMAYIVWRRQSFARGVWAATCIHAINNLVALSLAVFTGEL